MQSYSLTGQPLACVWLLAFLSVLHHQIMPWVLSVKFPCLQCVCRRVIDWNSANNSREGRQPGSYVSAVGLTPCCQQGCKKKPYIIVRRNLFWSLTGWNGCESLSKMTLFLRQPSLNIVSSCFFCSENNGRSTVPLQTKPEHAQTYMQNIKERLFSTHYHPSVLQQTPRHSRETLGKLYIVYSAECHPCNYPIALAPRCCG